MESFTATAGGEEALLEAFGVEFGFGIGLARFTLSTAALDKVSTTVGAFPVLCKNSCARKLLGVRHFVSSTDVAFGSFD